MKPKMNQIIHLIHPQINVYRFEFSRKALYLLKSMSFILSYARYIDENINQVILVDLNT